MADENPFESEFQAGSAPVASPTPAPAASPVPDANPFESEFQAAAKPVAAETPPAGPKPEVDAPDLTHIRDEVLAGMNAHLAKPENASASIDSLSFAPEAVPKGKRMKDTQQRILESIAAGWQQSNTAALIGAVTGRGVDPDTVLPEDAPWWSRLIANSTQLYGDAPLLLAGTAIGAAVAPAILPAAGALGFAATTEALPLVTGGAKFAGALGLSSFFRSALVNTYKDGRIRDFGDFFARVNGSVMDAVPHAVLGFGAGVSGVLAPAQRLAHIVVQSAAMTGMQAAMNKHVPSLQDFTDNALLMGGMSGIEHVANKLMDAYALSGVHPNDVRMAAESDPTFKQRVFSLNVVENAFKAPIGSIEADKLTHQVADAVLRAMPKPEAETPKSYEALAGSVPKPDAESLVSQVSKSVLAAMPKPEPKASGSYEALAGSTSRVASEDMVTRVSNAVLAAMPKPEPKAPGSYEALAGSSSRAETEALVRGVSQAVLDAMPEPERLQPNSYEALAGVSGKQSSDARVAHIAKAVLEALPKTEPAKAGSYEAAVGSILRAGEVERSVRKIALLNKLLEPPKQTKSEFLPLPEGDPPTPQGLPDVLVDTGPRSYEAAVGSTAARPEIDALVSRVSKAVLDAAPEPEPSGPNSYESAAGSSEASRGEEFVSRIAKAVQDAMPKPEPKAPGSYEALAGSASKAVTDELIARVSKAVFDATPKPEPKAPTSYEGLAGSASKMTVDALIERVSKAVFDATPKPEPKAPTSYEGLAGTTSRASTEAHAAAISKAVLDAMPEIPPAPPRGYEGSAGTVANITTQDIVARISKAIFEAEQLDPGTVLESEGLQPASPEKPASDAEARINAKIHQGPRPVRPRSPLSDTYTALVDKYYPVLKLEQQLTGGKELDAVDSPYKLLRLASGASEKAKYMLKNGPFDPDTLKTVGKGLDEIVKPLKGNYGKLRTYLMAARTAEVNSRLQRARIEAGETPHARVGDFVRMPGQPPGVEGEIISTQNPDTVLVRFKGENHEIPREQAASRLRGMAGGREVRNVETGIAPEDAEAFLAEHPELKPIQKAIAKFQRQVFDNTLVRRGIVSEADAEAMHDLNRDYVPLYRLHDPASGGMGRNATVWNPIRELAGSERLAIDPLESTVKNTYLFSSLGDRNDALVKLLKLAGDNSEIVKRVPEQNRPTTISAKEAEQGMTGFTLDAIDPDKPATQAFDVYRPFSNRLKMNQAEVYENGKKVTIEMPEEVAQAIHGTDRAMLPILGGMLNWFAGTARAGVTTDPAFLLRHAFREQFHNTLVSRQGYVPVATAINGAVHMMFNSETYQDYIKAGGSGGSIADLEREYIDKHIFQLNEKTGVLSKTWNQIHTPAEAIDALRKFSGIDKATEALTKIHELVFTMGKVGDFAQGRRFAETLGNLHRLSETEEGLQELKAMPRSAREAAFQARDMLDVARNGARSAILRSAVAFWNPEVQGFDRMAREFANRPVAALAKATASLVIPAMLLSWYNRNPDGTEDSRVTNQSDLVKNTNFIIANRQWEKVDMNNPIAKAEALSRRPDQRRATPDGGLEVNVAPLMKLPLPFAEGIMFGAGTYHVIRKLWDHDPRAGDGFGWQLLKSIPYHITPSAGVAAYEQYANQHWQTGRPIVNEAEQKLLPPYQYSPYTGGTAKALGKLANVSPERLDTLWRTTTGGLGQYIEQAADLARAKMGLDEEKVYREWDWHFSPLAKDFFLRNSSLNQAPLQKFQDNYTFQSQVVASLRHFAQLHDVKEVQRILRVTQDMSPESQISYRLGLDPGDKEPNFHPPLKMVQIHKMIGVFTKALRVVEASNDIKPREKGQLADTYINSILRMAEIGNQLGDTINQRLGGEATK